MYSDRKNCSRTRKAESFTSCFSTDLYWFSSEQLTLSSKDWLPVGICRWGGLSRLHLFQEIVTFLILIAVGWAFYRRYIEKLVRLKRGFKAGLVLIFIGGLMLTVLLGNGMNLIWHEHGLSWSEPIASGIAFMLSGVGKTGAAVIFYIAWWIHLLFLLSFLVYVPQSKHAHLIAEPANVFFNRMESAGKLEKIDFTDETKESYGAGKIEDFRKSQLLDLYACVECAVPICVLQQAPEKCFLRWT